MLTRANPLAYEPSGRTGRESNCPPSRPTTNDNEIEVALGFGLARSHPVVQPVKGRPMHRLGKWFQGTTRLVIPGF